MKCPAAEVREKCRLGEPPELLAMPSRLGGGVGGVHVHQPRACTVFGGGRATRDPTSTRRCVNRCTLIGCCCQPSGAEGVEVSMPASATQRCCLHAVAALALPITGALGAIRLAQMSRAVIVRPHAPVPGRRPGRDALHCRPRDWLLRSHN